MGFQRCGHESAPWASQDKHGIGRRASGTLWACHPAKRLRWWTASRNTKACKCLSRGLL